MLTQIKQDKRYLLALSGGIDSMALFHKLLKIREIKHFELHVAHVDHRWREESARQANRLKEFVEAQGVIFHLHRLEPVWQEARWKGNLEDYCRKARYAFFETLHQRFEFEAVLLAHHRDDLVETVLKRLFEGASLGKILALQEWSHRGALTLWRPLLHLEKKELASGLSFYLEDSSNLDERYLRARMRKQLIPLLEEYFGKNIAAPLIRHAASLKEIDAYLEEQVSGIWQKREGKELELKGRAPIEVRYLIKKLAAHFELFLSYEELERLTAAVVKEKNDFYLGSKWYVHRGCVRIL